MKYTIAFLSLALLGAGCTRAPYVGVSDQPGSAKTPFAAQESPEVIALKEGRIPPLANFNETGYSTSRVSDGPDCFGLESGRVRGGSLLKTLAHPEEHQKFVASGEIRSITTTSARTLDERIQASLSTSTQLLATYVCQLDPKVTLVGGLVWPTSKPTWRLDEQNNVVLDEGAQVASFTSSTLFLVTDKTVRALEGVRAWNPSGPPGGDPSPCAAALQAGTVRWTCNESVEISPGAAKRFFDKGGHNDPTAVYPYILRERTYIIPLNGGKISSILE